MHIYLKLLATLLMFVSANCWAITEINLTRSSIAILGQSLVTAPSREKLEFVKIALTQLYTSYEVELSRSLDDNINQTKNRVKMNRWRSATTGYLRQIDYVLNQIVSGSDYVFFVSQQGRIVFSVSGETVMITGPNNKADRLIEINILNQFCDLYDCQAYLSSSEEGYFKSFLSPVNGRWFINARNSVDFRTDNGIVFRFNKLANRKMKEEWSVALARDLSVLVEAIKLLQIKNYSIDWRLVSISPDLARDIGVMLTINKKGDFTKLALPVLSKNTEIFVKLKPWIQRSYLNRSKTTTDTILLSEQYFSEI